MGEGRVVSESVCTLAADLSLLRGETLLRAPAGTEAFSFGRRDGKMEVTAEAEGKTQTLEADVPADVTFGLFATIRFAEVNVQLHGKTPPSVWLPSFDPRGLFVEGNGKPPAPGHADVLVSTASAAEKTPGAPAAPDTVTLTTRSRSGRASELVLANKSRAKDGWRVTAVHGSFPHWSLVGTAPTAARRPDWFDRVGDTPQSAYQALCNFGRGYHLAKPELLDQAFHWPSMHAHEIASKTIEADVPLERMKSAYIQEFLDRSKHRTAADCDDLLTQILVTSEITKGEDGTVSIAALPVYGGHTFHCARKDGRWWIVRVD